MTGHVPPIRRATMADASALAALKRATFRQTFVEGFAIPYPPDDMRRFEEASYGVAAVAAELADADHATWVVEGGGTQGEGGALVAYVHAGPCKLSHPDVQPGELELYQFYMLRELQGGAMGRVLMERALGWMEGRSTGRLWLGVWSGNLRAQRFYARFGFERVGAYDFAVGDHRDHEYIYRRG